MAGFNHKIYVVGGIVGEGNGKVTGNCLIFDTEKEIV